MADLSGAAIATPGFMPAFDNTSITVATIDKTFEGHYDFKIRVVESVSAYVNTKVAFSLDLTVKIYALEMNLIAETVIADQSYLISEPALVLLAYMY